MHMPESSQKFKYIVAARDDLSGTCEAHALQHATSKELAKFFWEDLYCRYGAPQKVVTDNGPEIKRVLFSPPHIPVRVRWTPVDSSGLQLDLVPCHIRYWSSQITGLPVRWTPTGLQSGWQSGGLHWADSLVESTGVHWSLVESTGVWWSPLGSTGVW